MTTPLPKRERLLAAATSEYCEALRTRAGHFTRRLDPSPTPNERSGFTAKADKWGQQIAVDAFFNVAKEFWPDVRKNVFGR